MKKFNPKDTRRSQIYAEAIIKQGLDEAIRKQELWGDFQEIFIYIFRIFT